MPRGFRQRWFYSVKLSICDRMLSKQTHLASLKTWDREDYCGNGRGLENCIQCRKSWKRFTVIVVCWRGRTALQNSIEQKWIRRSMLDNKNFCTWRCSLVHDSLECTPELCERSVIATLAHRLSHSEVLMYMRQLSSLRAFLKFSQLPTFRK